MEDVESIGSKKAKKAKVIIWTKEALTRFFEEFETHPCLFETKSKFYANKNARADALSKICEALLEFLPELTVDDVTNRINNVRTQISHELKKIRTNKSGNGADDKYEPVWWFDLAQFLLPHIKSRKAHDSLLMDSDINIDIQEECEASQQLLKGNFNHSSTPSFTSAKKNKKDDLDDAYYNSTLNTLQKLNDSIVNIKETKCKEDEFGNFIAKELSEIDDIELMIQAKHEITNTVFKYKKLWLQRVKEISFEVID